MKSHLLPCGLDDLTVIYLCLKITVIMTDVSTSLIAQLNILRNWAFKHQEDLETLPLQTLRDKK